MNWKMKLYNTVVSVFVLSLFMGCNNKQSRLSRVDKLPYYKSAEFTPNWFSENDEKLKSFHQIPNFNLINQEGEIVTQNTFKDKVYVTDFFFTSCPGICPKMTANMDRIQHAFLNNDNVLLLSHSVTPEQDSVTVLKHYAEAKGIHSNKWHLVTGQRDEIYNLGRKAYFVEEDLGDVKTKDDFLHTENFVLIDKHKHIRGIYNGLNKTSVDQLIADVYTLLKE